VRKNTDDSLNEGEGENDEEANLMRSKINMLIKDYRKIHELTHEQDQTDSLER
jgi:hypothetical protein